MTKAAMTTFVGGFNTELDPKIDSQYTVNMYIVNSQQGKSSQSLVSMAGIKLAKLFEDVGEIRNLYVTDEVFNFEKKMYAVVANNIYELDTNLDPTLLGSIGSASGFVSISNNVNQIIFIDGSSGYIWDATTSTFSQITAAGFPVLPVDVAFLDGYFIIPHGNSNKFSVSALNDGLTWDALNFALMESEPDKIIAVVQIHRRVFLFGRKITEVWYDAGEADFPLRRDNNMLFQYGCLADGSIAIGGVDEDKRMFWLAGDENGVGSVMMSDGGSPEKISTTPLDYQIQSYSNPSDAIGIAYKIDGHTFYELSFTTDDKTWIYDLTTKQWFSGQMLNGSRKIGNCHAYYNGKHYLGSYRLPILYELSSKYTDNDGEAIKLERITGHFSSKTYRRIHISRITVDIVAGDGLPTRDTDPFKDVKMMCSINKDNKGFGNYRDQYLGRYGNRSHRCIYRRFGTARDWYFKFLMMAKSKVILLGAVIDYEEVGR
jgi:hypothetical protein